MEHRRMEGGAVMADQLLSDAAVGFGKEDPKFLSDADVGFKPDNPQKRDLGIVGNIGAGINKGIAGVAGLPVDAAIGLINHTSSNINKVAGLFGKPDLIPAIDRPLGGSESIRAGFNNFTEAIGAGREDQSPPTTPGQHMANAVGQGIASMVVPGLGAEAMLARTFSESASLGTAMARMIAGSGTASNVVIGAGAGVGSELAKNAASDPYKSVAELGGGLAGGVFGALAGGVGGLVKWAAQHAWQAAMEPAEVQAARRIMARATDPEAFKASLADGAQGVVNAGVEGEANLAGSIPTTFQATGDMGVGAYERTIARTPAGAPGFAQRLQDQNGARLAAIKGIVDPDARASAVTDYVNNQLTNITTEHAASIVTMSDDLASALTKAGGTTFDHSAGYGEALRAPLASLNAAMKKQEAALWSAIDPDRAIPISSEQIKQTALNLIDDIPSLGTKPNAAESTIYKDIKDLPSETSFGNMVAFRTRLTEEMRAERGSVTSSPTVLRRMSIVLGSLDESIAVKAGEIAADPVSGPPLLNRLQVMSDNLVDQRNASQTVASGESIRGGSQQINPGEQGVVSSTPRSDGAAGGVDGGVARTPGISSAATQDVIPLLDGLPADAAQRYAAARAITADRNATYNSGNIGQALRSGPTFGSYMMPGSDVPKNLFDKPEYLSKFLTAAKDNPDAINAMQDYAAFSLQKAAVRNGVLNVPKYEQWVGNHGYAMRSFPEVADNFATVAQAQSALDIAMAAQKTALKDYQSSAAASFLGDTDPVRAVGKAINDPAKFGRLVSTMRNDPEAIAGLKRAVVDYILGKTLSNVESGVSGEKIVKFDALQNFLKDNKLALSSLFNRSERDTLEAVAGEAVRAARSNNSVRIPGDSGTAQGIAGLAANNQPSVLQDILWKGIGTLGGSVIGHPVAGFLAGAALPSLRASRMDSVQSAIAEMMLNPQKAAAGIAKIPADETALSDIASLFGQRMRALTAAELTQALMRQKMSPDR